MKITLFIGKNEIFTHYLFEGYTFWICMENFYKFVLKIIILQNETDVGLSLHSCNMSDIMTLQPCRPSSP